MKSARLPWEVQVSVIKFALKTVDPSKRAKLRLAIRLVCREWNGGVLEWKEVEVKELRQIKGLVGQLEDEDEGEDRKETIRSVYFEMIESKGKDKISNVVKLLGYVSWVTRFEFKLGHKVFGGQEEGDTFSKKIKAVLVTCHNIKHFTLGGLEGAKAPMISLGCLKE